jgi:hypothetical protein
MAFVPVELLAQIAHLLYIIAHLCVKVHKNYFDLLYPREKWISMTGTENFNLYQIIFSLQACTAKFY